MHLAGCKYCRRFAEQSKYISAQLKKIKDPANQSVALTDEQKEKLRTVIDTSAQ